MTTSAAVTPDTAALAITLTPPQIRGLKLARDGDLYSQEGKKWTHLNPSVTFAKTDRFKERPIKIKFVTTATLEELRASGLVRTLDADLGIDVSPRGITMAGKIWLLKLK